MGSIYPMISGSSSFGNPAHPRCWLPADGSSGRVQGEACRGSLDWWQFSGWWFQYMDYYILLLVSWDSYSQYMENPQSVFLWPTLIEHDTRNIKVPHAKMNAWIDHLRMEKTKGHTQVAKNNRANIPSVCCLVFSYISPHTHIYIYICVCINIYHQLQSGTHTHNYVIMYNIYIYIII